MKTYLDKLIYSVRNLLSRNLFKLLAQFTSGEVLDVGGGNFYEYLPSTITFNTWTVIEPALGIPFRRIDERIILQSGRGEELPYPDNSFDTVLSIQVLEHVEDPYAVLSEMLRVLRPGGFLVVMVPQTSCLHLAPQHYYNFTKYWLLKLSSRYPSLQKITLVSIGGLWLSTASRMFYFFHHTFVRNPRIRGCKRGFLFWLLLPVSSLAALSILIVSLILSVVDLSEESTNHIGVFSKTSEASP